MDGTHGTIMTIMLKDISCCLKGPAAPDLEDTEAVGCPDEQ